MQTLIDPEIFVNKRLNVEAKDGDDFVNDFCGMCIGTHYGFLKVRDADGDVWCVEVSQVSIAK
jgi:hypothetical protein